MARSATRKLLDELPSDDEMATTLADLRHMDDAMIALMGAAYLDRALEILLKAHFVELSVRPATLRVI